MFVSHLEAVTKSPPLSANGRCLPPFHSSDGDLCQCREHIPHVKELGVGPTAPVALSRGPVVCSALREGPQILANFLVVCTRDRRTHDS